MKKLNLAILGLMLMVGQAAFADGSQGPDSSAQSPSSQQQQGEQKTEASSEVIFLEKDGTERLAVCYACQRNGKPSRCCEPGW